MITAQRRPLLNCVVGPRFKPRGSAPAQARGMSADKKCKLIGALTLTEGAVPEGRPLTGRRVPQNYSQPGRPRPPEKSSSEVLLGGGKLRHGVLARAGGRNARQSFDSRGRGAPKPGPRRPGAAGGSREAGGPHPPARPPIPLPAPAPPAPPPGTSR